MTRLTDRLEAEQRLSSKRLRMLEKQHAQIERLRCMNARLAALMLAHQGCVVWPVGLEEIVQTLIDS